MAGNDRLIWARCDRIERWSKRSRAEAMPTKKKSTGRNIVVSKRAVDEAFKALGSHAYLAVLLAVFMGVFTFIALSLIRNRKKTTH